MMSQTHLCLQSLPDSRGLGVQGNGILQGDLEGLQPCLSDLLYAAAGLLRGHLR
jgi:hypothetical protein